MLPGLHCGNNLLIIPPMLPAQAAYWRAIGFTPPSLPKENHKGTSSRFPLAATITIPIALTVLAVAVLALLVLWARARARRAAQGQRKLGAPEAGPLTTLCVTGGRLKPCRLVLMCATTLHPPRPHDTPARLGCTVL